MARIPKLTREKLALFLPTEELIRAYEALQQGLQDVPDDVAAALAAAQAAQAAADAAQAAADAAAASSASLSVTVEQHKLPVGAIFVTVSPTNPASLLGYGTWAQFGAGRVLVGVDTTDPDFDTVEEIGGSKVAVLP